MRRTFIPTLILLLLAAALPAAAGTHYTAETTTTGPDAEQATSVEAWVDGAAAKIVFHESGTPVLEKGNYIVTTDGGKTLYLVNPEEKAYAEWDLEAMLQMVGSVMQAMGRCSTSRSTTSRWRSWAARPARRCTAWRPPMPGTPPATT